VGPVCWSRCASGYTDIGALCHRNAHSYGKSCCYWGKKGCSKKKWGVCYKWHWGNINCGGCNSGYSDTGCTCFRPLSSIAKNTYGRGAGKAAFDSYTKKSYLVS
jgi:hypothetical protein